MAKAASKVLREAAELQYAEQLQVLRQHDDGERPPSWQLSPRAVLRYIAGGETLVLKSGRKTKKVEINCKFFGDTRVIEQAIITLASERALLLIGEPGTGKSWLSEHLSAAISGDSNLIIQGTAGTTEEQIKYGWNIAKVIAEGYRGDNLVASPTILAMRGGGLLRFEEITRCVPDVQDALVSVLSEKSIAVPELPDDNMIRAKPGFNVIATANSRDQGVNELSAALKRRFNYIYIPIVRDQKTEEAIVQQRLNELSERYQIDCPMAPSLVTLLTTVFREIRGGQSREGVSLTAPSTPLSTAEAISVALDATLHARYYGDGSVSGADIAANLLGSVVKEDQNDRAVLKEYARLVAQKRAVQDPDWQDFYQAAKALW